MINHVGEFISISKTFKEINFAIYKVANNLDNIDFMITQLW